MTSSVLRNISAVAGALVVVEAGSVIAGPGNDIQVAALRAMMRTVNSGDASGYADLYAPDAVLTIHGGEALEGREAIRTYEENLMRQFPDARLGFHDVWQTSSLTVVRYAVNGSIPDGPSMGHEGLLFLRFLPSGLIQEEGRYLDSLTPMAQLGALGPRPARPLPAVPDNLRAHSATDAPVHRENVARVRALLKALDSRDAATFLSGFANNAILDELIDGETYTGRKGVRAWLDRWTTAVPKARHEIGTILGVVDDVLVETVMRGTLAGALGPLAASPREFAVHRALVFHLVKGRVTRFAAFMNGKELAQATGQWPLAAAEETSRPGLSQRREMGTCSTSSSG